MPEALFDSPTNISQYNDQVEEKLLNRGRLKVFLGYATGVGKTYKMLEAAFQRLSEGVDVVIGSVNTRGNAVSEHLLSKFEYLSPSKLQDYDEYPVEMDINLILTRRPQLVLINDLAHTNRSDARHLKRYQEVEEILDKGINVYATLNIQNLESLVDTVYQITGIMENDTVPDRFVHQADEIEIIDLPPEELRDRLKRGTIFKSDQITPATEHFYRKGNLTALREITLRYVSDRVDSQMLNYMEQKSILGPWPTRDRILVAVSSHPLGERLVRAAHRLATNLDTEWTTIYVETSKQIQSSKNHYSQVIRTMQIAEDLGAKIVTINSNSIPEALINYAQKNNITKIIVGKPINSRFIDKFRPSLLDEIIRLSDTIDITVISGAKGIVKSETGNKYQRPFKYIPYIKSILTVLITTLALISIRNLLEPVNLVIPYLAVVVISALYFGRGPSMAASVLGMFAFDFFFIDPTLTFTVSDTQYLLTFLGLLVVGLIISNLTARVRDQVEAIQKKHEQTQALFSLSKDLNTEIGLEAILKTIIDHFILTIGKEAAVFLPINGSLEIKFKSSGFPNDKKEYEIAVLAFENNQPTGKGTDTFSTSSIRYQPLKTRQGVLGILAIEPHTLEDFHNPEQSQLLEAFTSLSAMAIERILLTEQAKETQVLRKSEKLQTALLNSISHDLRTPLSTITGVLDSLKESEQINQNTVYLDHAAKLDLIETASEETQRLNRLVGNLLDITKLEAGVLQIHKVETDLQDLISTAISHTQDRLQGHFIKLDIPEKLSGVFLDFILMEQVILNLLDNAIKYSPAGTTVDIQVRTILDSVQISVSDSGNGIPDEYLSKIFNKFHRIGLPKNISGTGLGLSICKGIIESHGGQIMAENRPEGGARFIITLPIK